MLALALAVSLLVQDAPAAAAAVDPALAPAAERWPAGAPHEDYPFVAWCHGVLSGYLGLHDEVMPEVTRIEGAFRRPGSRLEDDLKVYADMQKDGRAKLKLFQGALIAAQKASNRPIDGIAAQAMKQGRGVWAAGPNVTKARKAQEWMSWVLPARCETTAASLEARAKLMGTAFKVNEPEAPAPAEPAPPQAPPAS